ncbi:MAG: heme-dependent oxidative N-demethylase subunit alpha family protein [Gemmobacter sp.]
MTVLHPALPFAPWADPRTRRLPGVLPLDMDDWLQVDAAYAGQMGLRDALIAERPGAVHAVMPEAEAAAAELHDMVLPRLAGLGFAAVPGGWRRPDGVEVADGDAPLLGLGRLLQQDFCLMQAGPDGAHVLTGAILCFPAGWTLAEKLGRPMLRIHRPVAPYTDDVGRRVQRLLDAVRPDAPLWRANANHSRAPLFNPQPEAQDRTAPRQAYPNIRSERQCLVRLPVTRAVVFSIHTYLVRRADLTPEQAAALEAHPLHDPASA